jgi:PIN domain nuclease of toxin-antitoxin system
LSYLLDTQAFIWFLEDNSKLSSVSRKTITDIENRVLISIASYWEMAIKISIGKLKLPEPLSKVMEKAENEAIQLKGISTEDVLNLETLPFHHRDPFDRIIIATAISEDWNIISNDEAFDQYEVSRIW